MNEKALKDKYREGFDKARDSYMREKSILAK